MNGPLSRGRVVAGASIAASVAAVFLALAPASLASPFPSLTLGNDANQDGTYTQVENVAKSASYPDTVTFQVSINTGTFGPHTFTSLADTAGADLSGCNSLLNTLLAANSTFTCTYTLTIAAPSSSPVSDSVTATFDQNLQGNDVVTSSSTVNTPAMSVSKSSTTQFVGAIGQVVPYSYVITNTGSVGLTAVSLADNNTDSAPVCAASTIPVGGNTTCTAQHTVTASDLTGSSLNNLATASSNEAPNATATYSIPVVPPLGGTFVIGNLTYGADVGTTTPVNFWGAQWWKNNSLSGGTGPAAFKGFEDMPAAPACGQNWTTDPGNSTPPPAGPLPPYIAVIVSSKVTQTGSTIGGDTQHVVVVQTNSGYQGNPGHPGTGPIVATLC
ncbi:MAG TPA: hypothetical protein VKT31_11090 [Solirubrobacteraceae bacterium]|nr:hypothetical protein [Solirubrobacteraceae bacterium]